MTVFKNIFLLLVVCQFFAGCAANFTPEKLSKMSDAEVCDGLAYFHNKLISGERIEQEAIKRNLLSSDELALAKQGKISIGMTECAVKAAWGNPATVNTTITRGGRREQWVYGTIGASSYVYLENGKVDAIQN